MIKVLNPFYWKTEWRMQRYSKGKTDGFTELIVQRDCSYLAWEIGKPGPGTVLKERHTELEESPDPPPCQAFKNVVKTQVRGLGIRTHLKTMFK